MDFSKYYQWNKSESKEYNIETKQLWTRNAQQSFEGGSKAYHTGKTINQHNFANDLLKQSTDPTNSMAKIMCRFKHNLMWWKLGWKRAYLDQIHKNNSIMDTEKIHKILDRFSSFIPLEQKEAIRLANTYNGGLLGKIKIPEDIRPIWEDWLLFGRDIRHEQVIIKNMLCKEMPECKNIIYSEPEIVDVHSCTRQNCVELYFRHLRSVIKKLRERVELAILIQILMRTPREQN